MDSAVTTTTIDGFNKSLEELLHFGDSLKSREKKLEQRHVIKLTKQKNEFDIQLQIEQKRIEKLQTINRTLSEQIEQVVDKQIGCEEDYTVIKNERSNFD
jgi:Ni,Fe-hydrogenase maturation factor